MGASGPDDHGPYSVSCSRTAGWSASGRFQLDDNLSFRRSKGWSNGSSPLPRMACPLASGHDRCAPCGTRPIHSVLRTDRSLKAFCICSPVKPSPSYPPLFAPLLHPGFAAAITNYHSTLGDVDDAPLRTLSIVLVNLGSTKARLPVRLCETRETREPRPVDCPH